MKTIFSMGTFTARWRFKKLFPAILITVFLIYPKYNFGQGWSIKHTGMIPSSNPNLTFSVVDDNICWGLSYTNSQFCKTTNGGTNWSVSRIPDADGLLGASISAIDANTAWAVLYGNNKAGTLFKTIDGGSTWAKQNVFGQRSIPTNIHFFDINNGVAIGNPNQDTLNWEIYTTSDGGTNWNRVADANLPVLSAQASTGTGLYSSFGNNIWFGTWGGSDEAFYLYRSRDRGYTWSKFKIPGNVTFGIAFKDSLNGLSVNCFNGLNQISKTSDGGETWTALQNVLTNVSTCFVNYVPGANGCYIITSHSNIGLPVSTIAGSLCSTDDGATWEIIDNFPHGRIYSSTNGTGWSAGDGRIFKSVPKVNRTWVTQFTGLRSNPNPTLGFDAVDANVCWGIQKLYPGTKGPKVVRTIDGGETWEVISLPFAAEMLASCISALDANTAWTTFEAVGSGGIYKTTNGGIDWIKQVTAFPNGSGGLPIQVHFFDVNYGVSVGGPRNERWEIYTTSDGGDHWEAVPSDKIPLPDGGYNLALSITSTNSNSHLWFSTLSDDLYRTTDMGKTWTEISNMNRAGVGTAFKDELNGIATTYIFGDNINRASMTTDGGVTWSRLPDPPSSPSFYGIAYDPGNDIYVATSPENIGLPVATNPGTMYTKDGINWNKIDEIAHGPAAFSKDGTGWSSGTGDIIYKWVGKPTDVEEVNTVIKYFHLDQNYPNPFNPTTTISFSIPSSEFVTLKVYDWLGKEVATLVNEEKSTGNYKVNFNGASISTGIYFYTIKAGKFSATKKLILLK